MANDPKILKCTKAKYRSEPDAVFAINKIADTSKRKHIPVRAYLCGKCGLWHLTSQPNAIELSQENRRLNMEVTMLKNSLEAMSKADKGERIKVRADERVAEQREQIAKLNKIIQSLRKDKNDLLSKCYVGIKEIEELKKQNGTK